MPPHPFLRCLFDLVGTRGFIRDQMLHRSMVKHFSGTPQESAREVKLGQGRERVVLHRLIFGCITTLF